ncbi:uncharacterized protein PG998_006444 [Apiospora kogelbergensis]|uniref:uncharacterized protein n=1 Tax=Apiospora kogelbergensis TaxID=1337665 RepID=UPI00313278CA
MGTDEFNALEKLGPKIIPFVVFKLTRETTENLLAVVLCEPTSVTLVYTSGDEYFDLLDMGPGIIAHLMVEYYHNRGGFYYQLLHEIVHGRKMGAMEIEKPEEFQV